MTSFDELVGPEAAGAERERLRSVHELLLEAGPPPELSPELEAGPTLGMTLGRVRSVASSPRRRMFIPAIAAAVLVAAVIGISVAGNTGTGLVAIPLHGTPAAPQAAGTLAILAATKTSQPMVIDVHGLKQGTYAVYLMHRGRPWEKCGTFVVTSPAGGSPTTIDSPYRAKAGDTWVVTHLTAAPGHGVTVLTPVT